MSDVLTVATKRLETLKDEVSKLEKFLEFATELQALDPANVAPDVMAKAAAPKSAAEESGELQLPRSQMRPPGSSLRDSAGKPNGG